ncbi:CoA-binding domain protein [Solidesulfovibrio carbinoliphilus subsp. oakridgensis]|uniref:CoA-binding domain protein n=1 Tax=Solidesulfovibrio carbinoliphilus subsp. oakridgensis TaxID=694327 RepID=G7Q411_9BACT|nr:CoA-binding protein [Solidesulfovibrio carbinoliphilus]EHJ46801.1 CoA-binding domain protein [Solidesulfovibrio carbinoliphilus subsp. oakridgensis]
MLYSETTLTDMLAPGKTIAVVGAKDRPGTAVDMVGRYLITAGFRVVPVHPARASVWGIPARKTLAEVDGPIDIVDLFRAAPSCPGHAAEVLALAHRPACFWMQSGIRSAEARELLAPHGVAVVEDRCIMVEHRRLWG